jgi:regulator of protease activity HflC (stomatin/prohibitin superfamily)
MKTSLYVKNARKPFAVKVAPVAGYCLFVLAAALLLANIFSDVPVCARVLSGFAGAPAAGAPTAGAPAIGVLFVLAVLLVGVRKADEWERVIVLRFGKFRAVRGPGLYFVVPFIERAAKTIDIRVRVSDFAAQDTLTLDSVTITVDALCFWLVWDPEKAALEVENYEDAVILSAKTALRGAVSSNDLSAFLSRGGIIEKQIQADVDRKTSEWGITVLYTEITDVKIPAALQDSLSCLAKAEREKRSRVLLAEAEAEIAARLAEAARVYSDCAPALKLKALSILNEGLKAGNSMVIVPHSLTGELEGSDLFGLSALSKLQRG